MARPKGSKGSVKLKGYEELNNEDIKEIKDLGFVKALDDLYVNKYGSVLRIKEKDGKYYIGDLSPKKDRSGYYKVSCTSRRGAITIHELVMLAFVGPRPNGMEIDHIDRNKNNNRLENLRYVTHKENMENCEYAEHHRNYGKYFLSTQTVTYDDGTKEKMSPEKYLLKLKKEKRYHAYYRLLAKMS